MNRRKTLVAGHLSNLRSAEEIIHFVTFCLEHLNIKYTVSKLNGYYYVYFWLTKEQYKYICDEFKRKR